MSIHRYPEGVAAPLFQVKNQLAICGVEQTEKNSIGEVAQNRLPCPKIHSKWNPAYDLFSLILVVQIPGETFCNPH
jgi:hypothetical protein